MSTPLPAFIDLPEIDQAQEIRQYLQSAGAEIEGHCKENLHEEVSCLLDACDNWLKSAIDADLQAMMNSFISLILVSTFDTDKLVQKFCTKLTEVGASESSAALRIQILHNFFTGFAERNPLRFDVYCSELKLASRFGLTDIIPTSLRKVKEWLMMWNVSVEKKRICYRMLHDCLKDDERGEEATKVMLELLATYDEKSAAEAKDDAQKCVLDFISKPHVFIMDHLLQLRPVAAMEGQPLYQLLKIFVSGKLSDYMNYYQLNGQFMESLGLSHQLNILKMRILSLMSIASQYNEVDFQTLSKQLDLDEEDIEDFVIQAIKTKLVSARLDQVNRKVLLSSSSRRTFERPEWEELRSKLEQWRNNLLLIKGQLENAVPAY